MSLSAAYHNTAGKAEVEDAATGMKVDHVAVQKACTQDPTQPLRDRIAQRIANHVKVIECPTCVDVGCSIGKDCATLLAALGRAANVTGVDLMEAQLEAARASIPEASFVQGDAANLPLSDASVDSLQCARLLMHAPDLGATLDEFLRVMKPGAIAVFYEGDFRAGALLTSDATIAKVHAAKKAQTVGALAQPNVAQDILKYLLASPATELVTFDGFPAVNRDPTYGFPGMLEVEKGQLQTLVENGTLTQDEFDEYYRVLGAVVTSGDWVESNMLFEISFVKKA
jgi:ubiquinone/menaquinone biosynthesis C-methylase UbiE